MIMLSGVIPRLFEGDIKCGTSDVEASVTCWSLKSNRSGSQEIDGFIKRLARAGAMKSPAGLKSSKYYADQPTHTMDAPIACWLFPQTQDEGMYCYLSANQALLILKL